MKAQISIPVFLCFLLLSCINSGNRDRSAPIDNSPHVPLFCLPDSALQNIPVLSDTFFLKIDNIQSDGLLLSKSAKEYLIKQDIGVVFPRGFKVNQYDLQIMYLPEINLFLLGKWEMANTDAYVVKYIKAKESVIELIAITVINNQAVDAKMIALIDNGDCAYCDKSSGLGTAILPAKQTSSSIAIYSILPSTKNTMELLYVYTINDEGLMIRTLSNVHHSHQIIL